MSSKSLPRHRPSPLTLFPFSQPTSFSFFLKMKMSHGAFFFFGRHIFSWHLTRTVATRRFLVFLVLLLRSFSGGMKGPTSPHRTPGPNRPAVSQKKKNRSAEFSLLVAFTATFSNSSASRIAHQMRHFIPGDAHLQQKGQNAAYGKKGSSPSRRHRKAPSPLPRSFRLGGAVRLKTEKTQ